MEYFFTSATRIHYDKLTFNNGYCTLLLLLYFNNVDDDVDKDATTTGFNPRFRIKPKRTLFEEKKDLTNLVEETADDTATAIAYTIQRKTYLKVQG
jgi:hypothetical protein